MKRYDPGTCSTAGGHTPAPHVVLCTAPRVPQVDVFSFGVVAYELLARRLMEGELAVQVTLSSFHVCTAWFHARAVHTVGQLYITASSACPCCSSVVLASGHWCICAIFESAF